jgi:hypothetical protein
VILFAERLRLFLMLRRIFYFRLLVGLIDSVWLIGKRLHSSAVESGVFLRSVVVWKEAEGWMGAFRMTPYGTAPAS